jgi:ATP-dependent RNA helicase DeaD
MRMNLTHRSGRTARAGAKGISLTVLQEEEVQEIADFEKNWESNSQNLKPSALSIEENNTLLWAKQIFKTKPNHEVDAELKTKIKTVFHHLTKDELIENCWLIICCKKKNEPVEKPVKRQNEIVLFLF